jgi:hypothetical protein
VTPLAGLVADELAIPVRPEVARLAAAVAARHAGAARAVLFYGSCLRAQSLDGLMLDFYLIVSSYAAAFDKRWLATANRLLPPNVFPIEADGLVAKYAVLSEADFARLAGPGTSVSVWARFAQPSRLAWVADDAARQSAIATVARATPTLLATTRPLLPDSIAVVDLWRSAFALTYAAELRAERRDRAASVVDFDPQRYAAFTAPALAAAGIDAEIGDGMIEQYALLQGAQGAVRQPEHDRLIVADAHAGPVVELLKFAGELIAHLAALDHAAADLDGADTPATDPGDDRIRACHLQGAANTGDVAQHESEEDHAEDQGKNDRTGDFPEFIHDTPSTPQPAAGRPARP